MRAPIVYRHRIIDLRDSGLSYRNISKQLISEGLIISHVSVRKICEKYIQKSVIADFNRSGRSTIFNQIHYDYLEQLICKNREITTQEIILKINIKFSIKVSNSTIIRAAEKINWSRKTTRYCQIVSEKNAIKRALYANFCLLSCDSFMDCVFIDESLIELEVHTLKHWQKKGCRYNKAPVAKHPLK
ncbi:Transposable element Tcb2 transposase, partial [Brachionus plicatilis]